MNLKCIIFIVMLGVAGHAGAGSPLLYADTSSPRATMQSFTALTAEAADRYEKFRDSPSRVTQNGLQQVAVTTEQLFDLREVAPANRTKVAEETFYMLWEVLARLELPDPGDIPGVEAATAAKEGQSLRWRIPQTGIAIVQVKEGPYAGEYQFDADTIANILQYYDAVSELPYVHPMRIKNAYRINELSTGWMIPIAWVEALPDWMNLTLFGQVLWKWFATLLLIAVSIGIVVIVYLWARRKAWDNTLSSYLRYLTVPLAYLLVLPVASYFSRQQINVTGSAATLLYYVFFISYGITLVWMVWLSANQVADAIISSSPRVKAGSLNASLLKLISRSVGVVAVLVLVIRILDEIGVPVYGLVTGAGIGGIAIALAAKSTLENFMGALNLFADRPVSIGDLCRYDEESLPGWRPVGRVESIGLRSTKIRRLDRTLITIPNAEFAQRNIVNLTTSDRFLLATELGLRYETTDDQLRYLLVKLRELLHGHPETIHTAEDPIRVRFIGFGESWLRVEIRAYIKTTRRTEFLAIQEDILLRIMKIVKQAGSGIALPSRTLYFTRDEGVGTEERSCAEKQVREWASAQTLPFPDFAEEYRRTITDTLDYPPEGSPGADRG